MKDRIKYRIWDDVHTWIGKSYVYSDHEVFVNLMQFWQWVGQHGYTDKVEQCTGETDKDGVPVYEGDIVQGVGCYYLVKWDENFTGFIGRAIKIDPKTEEITEQTAGIMLRMKHKKVVGNINEGITDE